MDDLKQILIWEFLTVWVKLFSYQTGSWAFIEENNPLLYEEAIASVADDLCDNHEDCIEKGGNRYNNMKGLHTHRNKNK